MMVIVADDAQTALDLPSEYGVDDIPLILQDRQFENGRLVKRTLSDVSGYVAPVAASAR